MGRELGIPTIVAVERATSSIKNGDIIQINGSTGVVRCA
ncbi:MAG: PEP-utilizing enzyme [Candidatus Helarchaeota archaeon]